jgi:hypothetical protein
MHCYRGLRSANPEARFSRSVLARENPFSRPIVAETEFVITLDGHFSYYLPGPLLAHRVTSMRCGILLVLAHSGSRVSVRENTPRSVFGQMITYATSRSVVSSALAFGARRFSSEAMVAPMFSLRFLRLRASIG